MKCFSHFTVVPNLTRAGIVCRTQHVVTLGLHKGEAGMNGAFHAFIVLIKLIRTTDAVFLRAWKEERERKERLMYAATKSEMSPQEREDLDKHFENDLTTYHAEELFDPAGDELPCGHRVHSMEVATIDVDAIHVAHTLVSVAKELSSADGHCDLSPLM